MEYLFHITDLSCIYLNAQKVYEAPLPTLIGQTGATSAFFAATCGLVQNDLKRIIACDCDDYTIVLGRCIHTICHYPHVTLWCLTTIAT